MAELAQLGIDDEQEAVKLVDDGRIIELGKGRRGRPRTDETIFENYERDMKVVR